MIAPVAGVVFATFSDAGLGNRVNFCYLLSLLHMKSDRLSSAPA